MNVAILGATSQIAKDLILSFMRHTGYQCTLFSRCPEVMHSWLQGFNVECDYVSKAYADFACGQYDVVINFVGVGDPARAKKMGSKIFDVTFKYDQMAIDYIQGKPECKYIFLSSGAVYGDIFSKPASENSVAKIPVNQLDETYWYTISKLYAEARHRSLSELSIIDLRVFNYFSHTQDMSARFLITDIVRAIQNKTIFKTSVENITRDFLHPDDFFQLIQCVLSAGFINQAMDCYTKEPIDKISLLNSLTGQHRLCYEIDENINVTGEKLKYYSLNRAASSFGFEPRNSAMDCVVNEVALIMQSC